MPSPSKDLLEVVQALAALRERSESLSEKITENHQLIAERFEGLEARFDHIDHFLSGNGSGKSVAVRLDRLEQNESRRNRLSWAVITSLVAAAVAFIVKALRGN